MLNPLSFFGSIFRSAPSDEHAAEPLPEQEQETVGETELAAAEPEPEPDAGPEPAIETAAAELVPEPASTEPEPAVAMNPEILAKKLEYEAKKARVKELRARMTCTICGEKAKLNCPCGTTQYCSTDCQRVDWRERGHRKACKKIRKERATEAARPEAPTPPPSPPVYGPAPRSHADEVRARIAAEHEAARARREAEPEPAPESARWGSRCPCCLEDWDLNVSPVLRICCCRLTCASCNLKVGNKPCPLCRAPSLPKEGVISGLRRHIDNDVPEAMLALGDYYKNGHSSYSIVKSSKKAAKLYKRAADLGNVRAMTELGTFYVNGDGVKLDKRKGMALTRTAADRGFAMAQHNLAVQLAKDSGVFGVSFTNGARPESHNKVVSMEIMRLYRLAAEQGYTGSENNLGNWYMRGGLGVDVDIDEAVFWYRRAARKGHKNASYVLTQLGVEHIKGQAPSNPRNVMRAPYV